MNAQNPTPEIYRMTNNGLLMKMEQATINEGIFMEIEIRVRGRVKLWPRVLREETVQTFCCVFLDFENNRQDWKHRNKT